MSARGSVFSGALYLLLAQTVLLGAGYLLHVFVARWLGPVEYGLYGTVLAVLLWAEVSVNSGIPMAMRKFLAEAQSQTREMFRRGWWRQLRFALLIALVLAGSAPVLAALTGEARLKRLLWLCTLHLPFYALLQLHIGALGGMREFGREAVLRSGYSVLKLLLVTLMVGRIGTVSSAVVGLTMASAAGLGLAVGLWRRVRTAEGEGQRQSDHTLFSFARWIFGYALALSVVTTLGQPCVKAWAALPAEAGYYAAAQLFALVPSILIGALQQAVFPALGGAVLRRNQPQIRFYIRSTTYLNLLFLTLSVVAVALSAEELVVLVLSEQYRPAGPILAWLCAGLSVSALAKMFGMFLLAGSRPHRAAVAMGALIALLLALYAVMIPQGGARGAAVATLIGFSVATVVLGGMAWREFRVGLPPGRILRIAAATVLTVGGVKLLGVGRLGLFGLYPVLTALYAGALWLCRAVGRSEWELLRLRLVGPVEKKTDAAS